MSERAHQSHLTEVIQAAISKARGEATSPPNIFVSDEHSIDPELRVSNFGVLSLALHELFHFLTLTMPEDANCQINIETGSLGDRNGVIISMDIDQMRTKPEDQDFSQLHHKAQESLYLAETMLGQIGGTLMRSSETTEEHDKTYVVTIPLNT